jgi:hypothetical protein
VACGRRARCECGMTSPCKRWTKWGPVSVVSTLHGQGLIEGRIRCLLWRPTFPPRQDPRTANGSWVKGKEIPVDVLILASTSTCLRIVSRRFPGKPSLTAFPQDPRPLRPGSAALELAPPFQA